ncbi:MAG TPA: DNA helicase UvrD [Saprospiraceae bacterium]|nr:DNA helicase UvrD [Saprospiraceae bacterium]
MNIKIISAGAGSGKTFRLTEELVEAIRGGVRADGIIATTFTNKAAAELKERVTIKLLEEGLIDEAHAFNNALIGTVHSIGVQLLRRFAFVAGVSPAVDILPDEEHQDIFNRSMVNALTEARMDTMEDLVAKFDLSDPFRPFDWRGDVRQVADQARINDFSKEDLQNSKRKSLEQLFQFLGQPAADGHLLEEKLLSEIKLTRNALKNNVADTTATTRKVIGQLDAIEKKYSISGRFVWKDWITLANLKPAKKSIDCMEGLVEAAQQVDHHPQLRSDLETFIGMVFDMAMDAIDAYAAYKKQRGLIDYSDMETHIRDLLKHPEVALVLQEEIDLLMVDEFQDTSPIQLDIFWKIAQLVKESVWVGDPKQAIYSFRGAEPALMDGIVAVTGGIKKENILPYSWRSRADLVYFTNAVFTKAFVDMPRDRVALVPKRTPEEDSVGMENALIHWVLHHEEKPKGVIKKEWVQMSMAFSLQEWLQGEHWFKPKNEVNPRYIRPGDVAILLRTNKEVQDMSRALNMAGLDSAVAGVGLVNTAEVTLVLACLRILLSHHDSLAVAEALKYGEDWSLEEILAHRHDFLASEGEGVWAEDIPIIEKLQDLRKLIPDMTITEVLDLVLERIQIRRIVKHWSGSSQRLDNIALLRGAAKQFEDLCRRTHRPSTPAGFVIYMDELAQNEQDKKSGGENPLAVNVLTYHKSKGLEWPMVICASLGANLRINPFGVKIVNESVEMDVHNLLANRWLRYWISPFGKKPEKSRFFEQLSQHAIYLSETRHAQEEEARLLYVGITRARDYLVLPYVRGQMGWLNRVATGDKDFDLLEDVPMKEWLKWEGQSLPLTYERYDYGTYFSSIEKKMSAVTITAPKESHQGHLPYFWDVNLERPKQAKVFKSGALVSFAEPLTMTDIENLPEAASALHAMTIGFRQNQPVHNQMMVERILGNYRLDLDAEEVLDYVTRLHLFLQEKMGAEPIHRRYLLEKKHQNRQVSLQIDFWQQANHQIHILQNHFPGVAKRTPAKQVEELSNFFSWVREIAPQGVDFERGWVHLSLTGMVGELTV